MQEVRPASFSHGLNNENLAQPLAVIRLALQSADAARQCFPDYRLAKLVAARFELDQEDVAWLPEILGQKITSQTAEGSRLFDDHLRDVIVRYRLQTLFGDDSHRPHHHAIRPTGYDFDSDEVIPAGMEQWRADYRTMSAERQMLAASIIWLYRAGKDNVWLRRVPCTWHAGDAIEHMKHTNVLLDWTRLFALYPGW